MVGNTIEGFSGTPILEGNWVNPETRDWFTVKDCFFEDNNYVVMTTDGRRLDYSIIQHYVQTSAKPEQLAREYQEARQTDNADVLTKPIVATIPTTTQPISGVDAEMQSEIDALLRGNNTSAKVIAATTDNNTLTYNTNASVQAEIPRKLIKDSDIIERALGKVAAPEISLDVVFAEYPEKEISSLCEIMNVDVHSIAQWMYETYFHDNFEDIIIKKLTQVLKHHGEPQAATEIKQEEPAGEVEEVVEKPAKTTTKTSKSNKPRRK